MAALPCDFECQDYLFLRETQSAHWSPMVQKLLLLWSKQSMLFFSFEEMGIKPKT